MINAKSLKNLKRVAIILLIAVFSIAGIIACSGDGITGGGGRGYYSSVSDGGNTPSAPDDNPSSPDENPSTPGTTNTTPSAPGDNPSSPDYKPNLPNDNPNDYYDLRVPFVVEKGYTNVSYKDTNKLKQLWLDQINRKYYNDGKVFAIRNRANNRGPNDFQSGDQDYYYFNDNGDMVYKPDNTIIKKFVGATMIRYRDIELQRGRKYGFFNNLSAIVKTKWSERKLNGKPLHTVGGIYVNALTTEEVRTRYFGGVKQGVYDFITYWHEVEVYHDGWTRKNEVFERQYTSPGFVEVFVIYDHWEGGHPYIGTGAAVHSYFPYYGSRNTTNGFNAQTLSYMTNYNRYLGERPEYIMNELNCTASFTEIGYRNWHFLFLPGHKY